MDKTKKGLVSILLVLFMLMASLAALAGCVDKNKPPENSVIFKVRSSVGDEWLFDLEDERLYGEYQYTGEEIEIFVSEFICPYSSEEYLNHWRENYNPYYEDGIYPLFKIYCLYWDTDGVQHTEYRNIQEVGRYVYSISTTPTNCYDKLGYRSVRLEIIVTD